MVARQGLRVSIKELKDLLKEIERNWRYYENESGMKIKDTKKWHINIINRTPNCSDTWEIE